MISPAIVERAREIQLEIDVFEITPLDMKYEVRLEHIKGHDTIRVTCPRCGARGTLQISNAQKRHKGSHKFVIRHNHNYKRKTCGFGWTGPHWEQLNNIYQKHRGIETCC